MTRHDDFHWYRSQVETAASTGVKSCDISIADLSRLLAHYDATAQPVLTTDLFALAIEADEQCTDLLQIERVRVLEAFFYRVVALTTAGLERAQATQPPLRQPNAEPSNDFVRDSLAQPIILLPDVEILRDQIAKPIFRESPSHLVAANVADARYRERILAWLADVLDIFPPEEVDSHGVSTMRPASLGDLLPTPRYMPDAKDRAIPMGVTRLLRTITELEAGESCDILSTLKTIQGLQRSAQDLLDRNPSWECMASRPISGAEGQECDWPLCGCDPRANKMLAVLQDSGIFMTKEDPNETERKLGLANSRADMLKTAHEAATVKLGEAARLLNTVTDGWVNWGRNEYALARRIVQDVLGLSVAPPSATRILTRCPSCDNQTLAMGPRGHLVCTWLECQSPSLSNAILLLRDELLRLRQSHQVSYRVYMQGADVWMAKAPFDQPNAPVGTGATPLLAFAHLLQAMLQRELSTTLGPSYPNTPYDDLPVDALAAAHAKAITTVHAAVDEAAQALGHENEPTPTRYEQHTLASRLEQALTHIEELRKENGFLLEQRDSLRADVANMATLRLELDHRGRILSCLSTALNAPDFDAMEARAKELLKRSGILTQVCALFSGVNDEYVVQMIQSLQEQIKDAERLLTSTTPIVRLEGRALAQMKRSEANTFISTLTQKTGISFTAPICDWMREQLGAGDKEIAELCQSDTSS